MFKILICYILTCNLPVLMVKQILDTRIMKGKISERGMFPYLASLWLFDEHACGGSIITKYWILTAAHCVHYKENGKIIDDKFLLVSVGNESYKLGHKHKIERKIIHEGFEYNEQTNDISLLKVITPFKFSSTIQPIKLNPYPTDDYEKPVDCIVAGWGLTEDTYDSFTTIPSEKLRYAQVNSIPLSYCRLIFIMKNDPFIPSETNICVFTMVGRGTCSGDSGAPLVANNQQIGILSIGGECENKLPEVYIRISSYYTWIKKALGFMDTICDNLEFV